MNPTIDQLKNKRLVWRASQASGAHKVLPSGFDTLDAHLEGGLPEQGVVDISSPIGIGELRLLLPSFVLRQQNSDKLLVFIGAPARLNAPMLVKMGFELSRILIIEPKNAKDALWSTEQCLKSGCCDGVLLWHQGLEVHQAKRLQFAAETGGALNIVLRQQQEQVFSLPVALAMQLSSSSRGIEVTITKRKGGSHSQPFTVNMSKIWPSLTRPIAANNVLPLTGLHSLTG
jgi:hypothetical protein